MFEFAVSLEHRVRIDRQVRDHIFDRWQLVTRDEQAQSKRSTYLLYELLVRRHSRSAVQMKLDHRSSPYYTMVLAQWLHNYSSLSIPFMTVSRERTQLGHRPIFVAQPRRLDAINGDRYRGVITESMRVNGAADDELAELVDHYEKLTIEVERHRDPLLKTVVALGFATVWFRMGQFDRARERARAGGDHDWPASSTPSRCDLRATRA